MVPEPRDGGIRRDAERQHGSGDERQTPTQLRCGFASIHNAVPEAGTSIAQGDQGGRTPPVGTNHSRHGAQSGRGILATRLETTYRSGIVTQGSGGITRRFERLRDFPVEWETAL